MEQPAGNVSGRGRRDARHLILAASAGGLCGLRSMLPLFLISRALRDDRHRRLGSGGLLKLLAGRFVNRGLAAAAAGEMLADKTPFLPARVAPLPLAGRLGAGAAAGLITALTRPTAPRHELVVAGVAGAVGALAASFAAYHLRRALSSGVGVPDLLVALGEDALCLRLGRSLTDRI